MVSHDGRVLITDFGFATIGQFGPPPLDNDFPLEARVSSLTTTAKTEIATAQENNEVDNRTGGPVATDDDNTEKARGASGLITGGDRGSSRDPAAKAARCSTHVGDEKEVIDAGETPTSAVASGRYDVETRHSCYGIPLAAPNDQEPQFVACDEEIFDSGTEIGARTGSQVERQEDQPVGTAPSRDCILFGSLKGFTPRYQSPEVCAIMDYRANAGLPSQAHQVRCMCLPSGGLVLPWFRRASFNGDFLSAQMVRALAPTRCRDEVCVTFHHI